MNRAILEERKEWFIKRLEHQGKFEYISGYVNMKENVIVRHKKCGKVVSQKAYTLMYSNLDKCYECNRFRRGYQSIKENIIHKDTLGIVDREKFGFRYRYKCKCRVCGELYYFNKKQLENGIECCIGKTSRIDRIATSKAQSVVRELKKNEEMLTEENVYKIIENSYNDIALIKTCVADTKKLFTKIQKEVMKILEEKEIKNCPSCNRKIKNKGEWRIDFLNNKRKICKDCKSKKIDKK